MRRGLSTLGLAALLVLGALALVACSGDADTGSEEGAGGAEAAETGAAGATAGEAVPEGETLTVGWIFAGPDATGAVPALESAFEGRIESVVETEAGDPATAARSVVDQGAGLVVSTVTGACAAVPDIPCVEPGEGEEPGENAVTLDDAFWTRAYLLGLAAGLVTETDNVGFVAAGDSPQQKAAVNAFALGCQSGNTNCLVRVTVAPENLRAAFRRLRDADVDVVASTVGDPALCEVVGRRIPVQPVIAPGDPCGRALVVASPAEAAGPLVEALLAGEWEGGRRVPLALGEITDRVPQDAASQVEEKAAEIEQGANVFTGPLFDNEANQQLAEGEELSPEFIASQWDWYLGGVFEEEQQR